MSINGPIGRPTAGPLPPKTFRQPSTIKVDVVNAFSGESRRPGIPDPRDTFGAPGVTSHPRFRWPFSRRARYEVRLHLSPQPAFDLRIFVTRADNAPLTEADIQYMRDLARTVRAIFCPLEEEHDQ